MTTGKKTQPAIIRKYANRRLYNTEISSYVTLDDLCTMVKNDEDFVVLDAKSGEDLTKTVLTQIIFEQESKGENLLPTDFLKNVIGFYDDSLKNMVPVYLNSVMQSFMQKQEELKKTMTAGPNPFKAFEDSMKSIWGNQQNMVSQTMDLWNSFNPLIKKDEKK